MQVGTKSNGKCPYEREAGTSLVVQWLKTPCPNVGGLGSIAGQENYRFLHTLQLKILSAATKTWHGQINK